MVGIPGTPYLSEFGGRIPGTPYLSPNSACWNGRGCVKAVFSGIPTAEGLFEKRCLAVCFANIETGRLVSFVNFEDGRAIQQGAIHLESLIPKVGLEPTPSREDRILSPARLPSSPLKPTHG